MSQIKVSEILNDLINGLTREDIKKKYNMSTAQLKAVFAHPKLKGRKTKKAEEPINLIDDLDTTEIVTPTVAVTVTTIEEAVEEVESIIPATLDDQFV